MDDELERLRARRLQEMMTRSTPPPAAASGGVVVATDETLPALVAAGGLLLVDCYADWCAPCRVFAPTFAAAAREYAGRATFAKLDTDANPQTSGAFRIMSIPTLLVFQGGRLVRQQAGALPPQMLHHLIESHLKPAPAPGHQP